MRIRKPALQTLLSGSDGTTRAIPFVSTPFAFDLMLFLALWPLWWILGVDQILPPFFLAWEAARYLWQARGRFTVSAPIVWAALLALWWLAPALWLDREYLDIFVKETATAWAQVFMLFLFWNAVRTAKEWNQAARGLLLLATYVALGGLVFALGLWRGTTLSALGRLFPGLAGAPGGFFATISYRGLGRFSPDAALLPFRLISFALQPTYLSMLSLVLLPFVAWRFYEAKGPARTALGIVIAGLLVCLVGTDSRVAYLAFGVGVAVFVVYASRSWRRPVRLALFGSAALVGFLAILAAVVGFGGLDDVWQAIVVNWRPGSLVVRSRVYEETFRLLPEHPIAGWGVQMRIEGLRSSFSAGSHSSILAMLFRHGAVGLALYIGLWVSMWREVVRGFRDSRVTSNARRFFLAAAIAFLGFNIRELSDEWWWDQTVTMTLWMLWGLTLALPRARAAREANLAASGAHTQVNVLGVNVGGFDVDSLNGEIAARIEASDHAIVANVNVHCLNLAWQNPWLRDFLNEAHAVFCDGAGVVLGARILSQSLPGRITFADWTWSLAGFAAERGFSFYFLGARPGVAEKAAARLRERFPNLRIAGTHHGYFDKTPGSAENEAVIQQINAAKPNILFVGFGMPLQERWLKENWPRLDANVALTCGAMFDYVSGELRRAPKWMNDHGLEWLGRLIIEPRRLWKRYLIGNPLFMWRVLKQRLRQEMAEGERTADGHGAD